jgi:hypothetical protein
MSPLVKALAYFTDWFCRGSEVVFELYSQKPDKKTTNWFLRVLFSGQPIVTSLPLGNNGTLDMIPVQDFFDCKL